MTAFFIQFQIFLFFFSIMSDFSIETGTFLYYVMRLWMSFEPFVLAGFLWHASG